MSCSNFKKFVFILLIVVISSLSVHCKAGETKIYASLEQLISGQEVLALTYWDVDNGSILCLATISNENRTLRKLSFYRVLDSTFDRIGEYTTYNGLFQIIPLTHGGNLLTVWTSGSALMIRVFSLIDKKITTVLESGTRLLPEIADIDNDGEMEIMISNGRFIFDSASKKVISYPDTAEIYKWNGSKYDLLKTVRWLDRFNIAEQLSHHEVK